MPLTSFAPRILDTPSRRAAPTSWWSSRRSACRRRTTASDASALLLLLAKPQPHDAERGELLVDYNLVPPAHPPEWPAIRRNESGLSRFVYGFMIDRLRGVSKHVTIGSAARKGKDMGSWFVLCRES
jgi:hypothetical protein